MHCRCATLFTTTPDQRQTVIIITEELVTMPLDALVGTLVGLTPTDSTVFLPEFSTTTFQSRMARYAAFADLVSPYYDYMMMMCGIPYIDVQGTEEDYEKVVSGWNNLTSLFPMETEYFSRVAKIIESIYCNLSNSEYWKSMFRLEKCGSGSDVEAYGWWTDLYRKTPSTRYVENFSSHLACVKYQQLDTKKNYEMIHGLLGSTLQEDCLVPDFGSVVFEKLEEPICESMEEYKLKVDNHCRQGKSTSYWIPYASIPAYH